MPNFLKCLFAIVEHRKEVHSLKKAKKEKEWAVRQAARSRISTDQEPSMLGSSGLFRVLLHRRLLHAKSKMEVVNIILSLSV